MPVSSVNAASDGGATNESYASSVSVAGAPAGESSPHATKEMQTTASTVARRAPGDRRDDSGGRRIQDPSGSAASAVPAASAGVGEMTSSVPRPIDTAAGAPMPRLLMPRLVPAGSDS